MQVINTTNTVFSARRVAASTREGVCNNTERIKKSFYDGIRNFMSDKCSKKDYLQMFQQDIGIFRNLIKFNPIEQDYIRTLQMTVDSCDSIDDIPDGYLKWLMNNMLARKG